jgi:hypothetical protein
MKLAMMRTIAHHTNGDAKPLIPVQENASSGAATSLAPRFKRSSEANTHTTLKRVAATGSQSRMADFASAFLARDQSTATDFELRLVGRVTPCAPGLRRAEDCPPYQ